MGVIETLANNGRLLCFTYSGFYAARHNIIIIIIIISSSSSSIIIIIYIPYL
jgi:hypothetical protein